VFHLLAYSHLVRFVIYPSSLNSSFLERRVIRWNTGEGIRVRRESTGHQRRGRLLILSGAGCINHSLFDVLDLFIVEPQLKRRWSLINKDLCRTASASMLRFLLSSNLLSSLLTISTLLMSSCCVAHGAHHSLKCCC
jgi:hypothetical protein